MYQAHEMRRTLGSDHHPAEIVLVEQNELGEHFLIFCRTEVGKARATSRWDEEVGIERYGPFARRPLYQASELRTVAFGNGRLDDEVEFMLAQARDRGRRGFERAVPAAEVVVMFRCQGIDGYREAGDARILERHDASIVEEGAVGANNYRRAVMHRMLGDALEVRAQERLAAGEDEQRRGIQREDLSRDAQALCRRQLTRRRLVWARRDVAVGTLEIAAAREIP